MSRRSAKRSTSCDSSALVKLIADEAESEALDQWLGEQTEPHLVSTVLARTEVRRAIRRRSDDMLTKATELLDSVSIVELEAAIADEAGGQDPPSLHSLDAIHLASAQRLGAALAAFVAYDTRLVQAAEGLRLTVVRPGVDSTHTREEHEK
ncbi:MAG: type II toxin-antitoxin system VapC family toxin [Actinobacteria bacterium]|nr:type II toxin-antitoxin system VapC family toxin [Actinomycetota bacterium]